MKKKISFTVNGKRLDIEAEETLSLLRFLREELGLVGTKNGCEKGHCGSCTVIVNGEAKRSCIQKMGRMNGAVVETIEGISNNERLNYIQEAFIAEGAVQCGFCTPGMIMAAKALLDKNPHPSEADIQEGLKNNLCRCTGYAAIIRAVQRAAGAKAELEMEEKDRVVGVSVIRKDAEAKVRGSRVFADDYIEEDMTIGKLLFSEHAHAKIRSIDISEAEKAPGVVKILTGKDVPGRNAFGLFHPQQPVIAKDEVKYLGEIVAVVYAETREEAEYARNLIQVDYEVLEPQLSAQENIKEDASLIHPDQENNIVHYVKVRKGELEKGFEQADVVIEGHYYTPAIEHGYLEPESCLAKPGPDGKITVWTGNQGSQAYQDMIAKSLDIPIEKVRVIYTPCGGGFGGKEEPTVQIQAALGAMIIQRPVKIVLTREESIRTSIKRHPMHIWMKHGAAKDGTLLAMQSKVIGDAGAYISQTMPVIFRSAVTATGPYVIPNVKADSYGVYTHNNPSGAFRGFGSTQACFAAEIQMDKIAEAIGMDSVELRRKNGFETGKVTSTGQVLKDGIGYLKTLEAVTEKMKDVRTELEKVQRPEHIKLGFGIASAYKNVGIGTGLLDQAGAVVEVNSIGRVLVKMGATDMGQGADTICAQIASEALGVSYDLIDVVSSDTQECPDGGMTTASRQTYVTGNAVKKAALLLKDKLNAYEDGTGEISQEKLTEIYHKAIAKEDSLQIEAVYTPPKTYAHRACADHKAGVPVEEHEIHYAYCFASIGAAVEVNTQTGEVRVIKVCAAQDVGKAIHPQNVKGQIEGAVVMGVGFALSEEFLEDDSEIITNSFHKLQIPKIKTTPNIDAIIVEEEQIEGPYGAKGMGEVGLNPMAPAISNAIYDAVGVRLQSLPMKKEKVLAALKGI